jgi:hypothetical protein
MGLESLLARLETRYPRLPRRKFSCWNTWNTREHARYSRKNACKTSLEHQTHQEHQKYSKAGQISASPTWRRPRRYDALPEIGHACGHNLIGTGAVGAFLGLAAVADRLGGEVVLLGTPGEEGGGKIKLLDVPRDLTELELGESGTRQLRNAPAAIATGFS